MVAQKKATAPILLLEAAPPGPLQMAVETVMVKSSPKESTGKDSNMGGADGGTAGMGYSKEDIEPKKED